MLTLTDLTVAPLQELVERASAEPILGPSDMARLAERVNSYFRARVALAHACLRLAVDEAIRNRGLGFSQEQLVRVATIAVIDASNDFDPERDGGFERFVRRRVRRALDRMMAS